MKREEDDLQRAIVNYLRAVLSERDFRVFAVPNGGARNPREGANLKRSGVLAGVPDLLLIGTCGKAYFIEVKTAKGVLSAAQKSFRDWMMLASVPYVIARSLADVETALRHWNIKTRVAA